jgi:putative IMPACT (imprinted ancient) family translation regulator
MATRIHSNTQHTLVIKHSTFIAHLMRAMDFGEARLHITALKAQHPMASHVTFAFRSAREERSSDAGEPVGSAGKVQLKILREKIWSMWCRWSFGTMGELPWDYPD